MADGVSANYSGQEVFMKKLLVCLILLISVQVLAEEKTKITVKSTEKNSGVIVVAVNDGKKMAELNCNEGFPECAAPKPGEYWMVTLPKNHGVYECQNVDLFPSASDPDDAKKVGEYCLLEK
jgi:hypothetical protein